MTKWQKMTKNTRTLKIKLNQKLKQIQKLIIKPYSLLRSSTVWIEALDSLTHKLQLISANA